MQTDSQGNVIEFQAADLKHNGMALQARRPLLDPPLPARFHISTEPMTRREIRRELRREKKVAKAEQKEQKKFEKEEFKKQHKEAKILAKQPSNFSIYAVPLIAGESLLLTTTNSNPCGRVRAKVLRKYEASFAALPQDRSQTVKGRVLRWSNRRLEGLSPSTVLLSNTPKNIAQVSLHHPSSLPNDQLFEDLLNLSISSKSRHKKKLIIYSVAFPFIAAAEAIAPVWPNIVTVIDAAFIYFHATAVRGSNRLILFAANRKESFVFDPYLALDKWAAIVAQQPDGVLDEIHIQAMCNEIGAPELIGTLCKFRRRYLRAASKSELLPPKQR